MALTITASKIESTTGIKSRAAEKAALYAPDAERALKELITSDVYNTAVGQANDHADYVAVERASCFLAFYYAIPMLNMRPADAGGLLRSVGMGDFQEELLSHGQMQAVRSAIWDFVQDIVGYLVPVDETETGLYQGKGFGLTAVPKNDDTDYSYRTGTGWI